MCAMVNVILDAKNQSFKLTTIDGIDLVSVGANFCSFIIIPSEQHFCKSAKIPISEIQGSPLSCPQAMHRMVQRNSLKFAKIPPSVFRVSP